MKSTNQIICEYVAANPLCSTGEVAAHIGRSNQATSKLMNQLEVKDYLRCPTKENRQNLWIRGTNSKFNAAGAPGGRGHGGGRYYPQTGAVGRKRIVTVTANAADAIAMIKNGFKTMTVV
jgi:hypothetical protein